MRNRALDDYRFEHLCWCLLAPHVAKGSRQRPPQLPAILKGQTRHGHP
jgi:hypothetical protein